MDYNLSDIHVYSISDIGGRFTILKIIDGNRHYSFKVKGHTVSEAWLDYMKIIFLYELKLGNVTQWS